VALIVVLLTQCLDRFALPAMTGDDILVHYSRHCERSEAIYKVIVAARPVDFFALREKTVRMRRLDSASL
jgi:hypothetical protein